uniref:Ctr_82_TN conopeptide n=1 Tax=Conus tribblei TaxID=101761 RepID=A0A0C9R750_CONTD
MKLSVTFLLILMILPSVTGEKSSKHTLRRLKLASFFRGGCSEVGERCGHHSDCCWQTCCFFGTCGVPTWGRGCDHF